VQAYYTYSWTTLVAQFGGWVGLFLGLRQIKPDLKNPHKNIFFKEPKENA
jgi:hypothetical protein